MGIPEGNDLVLIADDSVILNNMLKDVFEDEGFEVVQAFDGAECKSTFLQHSPDLVLLDLLMPRANGIEALRFIKAKSPKTIVIVMTGQGNERIAVKAMKLGADDYLRKPFGMPGVVSLARRLIDRRRAGEENLKIKKKARQGERYLAHLATIISEAIISTDGNGRIQFINRAATRMWGYTLEELKGKDIHFLVRGEARTLLHRDLVKETIKAGKVEGEFHFRKKDNGTFPGYLSTSIVEEGGRYRGIVAVVADLSRLSEVERRLKQSEKLASLGKVVEGIAHEVRNCLTSLGGFALRLQKITAGDATCQRYTGVILEDVARLESMVKEIEGYVRFSKFYTFRFVKTDVVSVIERARDRAVQRLPPEVVDGVTLRLLDGQEPAAIDADPEALEEVFFNLILNAYEAMPRGGRITITIKRLKAAVSVTITDTGVGIHKEDLKEIFNPFFTSKTTGAGMGLSKVLLLVEEHRGAIDVASEPGKGTTVELFLPTERLMTPMYAWDTASSSGSSP